MGELQRINLHSIRLIEDSPFYQRSMTDLRYLLGLREEYLLQNYYLEAGLLRAHGFWDDTSYHKGWEDPSCQLRGHFLGHWLSAACYLYVLTADSRLKGKIDYVISELERCQKRNGNGWVGPIPEKYLEWIARGEKVWAPHYTLHKLLMGLVHAAELLSNMRALEIAAKFAEWFKKWTSSLDFQKMQDILDVETGGMMEAFGDLYALTKNPDHLQLMKKYEHKRLFDKLIEGKDILTNRHANTTIPEVHGICRAYEITAEKQYLDIMLAYWKEAVTNRGNYISGGQSLGEIWGPKEALDARLGHKTQELCTVYNMIRLADYLYRETGDSKYQDYIELNCYNGILAQCFWEGYEDDYGHHSSWSRGTKATTVSYFLPLSDGVKKTWSSTTDSFFCCHGTAVQACATFQKYIMYKSTSRHNSRTIHSFDI